MDTANTPQWKNISVPIYICVMLFALSSWIDVCGLYAELPLLVNKLPENWTLPSYMAMTVQISNIGPLFYVILTHFKRSDRNEVPVIYLIIGIGVLACALLVPFWNKTVYFLGQQRSLIFLSLTGLLAIVDCTSSVVYLSYMKRLHVQYMPAFYIGQSLCGFIPGMLGILQGVSGNPDCVNVTKSVPNKIVNLSQTEWQLKPVYPSPTFSVEVFLIFICAMICVSGISFSFLEHLPYFQKAQVKPITNVNQVKEIGSLIQIHNLTQNKNYKIESFDQDKNPRELTLDPESILGGKRMALQLETYIFLLIVTALINAVSNGILPSIKPYSCLPYGKNALLLTDNYHMLT